MRGKKKHPPTSKRQWIEGPSGEVEGNGDPHCRSIVVFSSIFRHTHLQIRLVVCFFSLSSVGSMLSNQEIKIPVQFRIPEKVQGDSQRSDERNMSFWTGFSKYSQSGLETPHMNRQSPCVCCDKRTLFSEGVPSFQHLSNGRTNLQR